MEGDEWNDPYQVIMFVQFSKSEKNVVNVFHTTIFLRVLLDEH